MDTGMNVCMSIKIDFCYFGEKAPDLKLKENLARVFLTNCHTIIFSSADLFLTQLLNFGIIQNGGLAAVFDVNTLRAITW